MTNKPTDHEIDAIVYEQTGFDGDGTQPMTADEMRRVTRAVLARWGQPANSGEPVAWVDERVISWLANSRANSATIGTTLEKGKSSERPLPLYTAPQPVEREPLTDEQSYALLHRMADESDKWAEGLSYEPTREQVSGWCVAFLMRELPAHGIKGGQHGTE